MQTVAIVILWITASSLVTGAAVVAAELFAAARPRRMRPAAPARRRRVHIAVLVPAHDEEAVIGGTLRNLMKHIGGGDRLIVVADNCTDATAEVARRHGAEVIERIDPTRRGKGYAIEFGRKHLAENPPDVVVMIDADCQIAQGELADLAHQSLSAGAPLQAIYIMDPPPGGAAADTISAFAVHVKNYLRPVGLARMGGPCLLLGSGMAFPWPIFAGMRLDHAHVVEDMKMAVDTALAGTPPRLCEDVIIRSSLPDTRRAARSQRTRWEHGHLLLILTQAPKLLLAGLIKTRLSLLALGVELAVPPLSLFTLTLVLTTAAGAAAAMFWQTPGPLLLCLAAAGLLAGALASQWHDFHRSRRLNVSAWSLARYIASKIPIYAGFPLSRQREWVRTPRNRPEKPVLNETPSA